MLSEEAVCWSSNAGGGVELWCDERAEEAEREGFGAVKERRCKFCQEQEAVGLLLGVEACPQAQTRRCAARGGSWMSRPGF